MSADDINNKKNLKPPVRPKGVREADKESTGFIQINSNEKDPLIELFDTLQTVKEKNEHINEKSNTENSSQQNSQFITPLNKKSFYQSPFFKIFTVFCFLAISSSFGWIAYQVSQQSQKSPPAQISKPVSPSSSFAEKTESKTTSPQTYNKDHSSPRKLTQNPERTKTTPKPAERNEPKKLDPPPSKRAGSFFPEEDPGDYYEDEYYKDEEPEKEEKTPPANENSDPYAEEYSYEDEYLDEYESDYLDENKPNSRKRKPKKDQDTPRY